MILDDEAAYALASWSHFDDAVSDNLMRAVTGAFALVAACDGNLSSSEVDRFMEIVRQQADTMTALDFDELEHAFRDICAALMSEPEQGRQRALECVAAVKSHTIYRELVRSAAVIAMRADERETDKEHAVLAEICEALGLGVR